MTGFNVLPSPSWSSDLVQHFVNVGLTAEQ